LLLDCTDEVIKYPKTIAMNGLPILAQLSAVWILREITEWLRLPTKPSNGALLAFAHYQNFKLRVS
jgi:hypothetical protein